MLALVAVLSLSAPAAANAYSLVITNGLYFDTKGVFAPRHTLTAVDIDNTSPCCQGYASACENARNGDGSWAQQSSICVLPGGYYSHPFCACQLREGWNGPGTNDGAYMLGIEYY